MTDSGTTSFNSADGDSRVDVQAGTIYDGVTIVHGDQRFEVPPGASSADKYRVGVNNLTSGMATKAHELIWDAMMEGYQSSEVLFHWLLAMLGGRTIREFSDEELSQLRSAEKQNPTVARDPWAEGVRLIFRLLESVGLLTKNPRPDISLVVREFDSLGTAQRELLLPYLELFLEGPLKDEIWQRERSSAGARQLSKSRRGRAWIFFQPVPIEPRVRRVQPVSTTLAERRVAWTGTVISAAAIGYFGWELLWHGAVLGLLAYVICLACGAAAAREGFELRFLTERRRLKDEQFQAPRPPESRPPRNGFAERVDALFSRYAAKYVPDKEERATWEAATSGIRKFDRDEIVTMYRESRIPVERVAWLIRYRIHQSRNRWKAGTLYYFREQLRPKPGTVTACWVEVGIAVPGGAVAIGMLRAYPLVDAASAIVAILSGIWTWRNWLRIDIERRRFAADSEESEQRLADSRLEFARWTDRLKRCPSDSEMATWLECDRTILLGQAIDHYKLSRSQVITHAFLEEPGTGTRRARVRNGPMRYSRYRFIVFLLTSDGVRQMWADLAFPTGTLRKGDRISYRYDAVASAHVSLTSRGSERPQPQQSFRLTLVNGDPISTIITDLDPEDFEPGEDTDSLSRATLDAASVTNTLHVLEGIAAEGRGWFQERKTGHRRETY